MVVFFFIFVNAAQTFLNETIKCNPWAEVWAVVANGVGTRVIIRAQLFKKFNLDQNDPDLEIPANPSYFFCRFFFFQSNIRLDHTDPDSKFKITKSGLPEL